jgi:hypothetical protein
MRGAFTMRFQPDVAEFVQNRARAENRSVTNYVETLLLREKERVAETEGRLTVQADPELLREEGHRLVREDDETDEEYAARSVLFGALLTRAREG